MPNCSMTINKKNTLDKREYLYGKEDEPMDYSVLDNDEIIDSGYGFIDNRGIEVCSDRELYELD